MEAVHGALSSEARGRGYTETLLGRRRYLPELDSGNFRVRQAAERQAMNAGIQGLAADIFKVALVRLDQALKSGLLQPYVLQVHDEILVEAVAGEEDEALALTVETMEHAFELRVPMTFMWQSETAGRLARSRLWTGRRLRDAR